MGDIELEDLLYLAYIAIAVIGVILILVWK